MSQYHDTQTKALLEEIAATSIAIRKRHADVFAGAPADSDTGRWLAAVDAFRDHIRGGK